MVVVLVALLVLAGAGTAVFLMAGDGKAGGKDTATGPETTAPKPAGTSAPDPAGGATGEAIDAKVGDCVKVNDASATEADIETIDCAQPAAVYKIGVREEDSGGQCPSPNYVSYTEEGVLLLCMTLNAHKGECFHETDEQDTRVGCDSPDASYKVGDIVEGTADANRCGTADAANALTYPKPPLTICRLSIE
jgi:hypothetical protein